MRQKARPDSFILVNAIPVAVEKKAEAAAPQLPVLKQYREADGKFYFKLSSHDGRLLLQSEGLDSGRDAGQWGGRLKSEGAAALDGVPARFGEGVNHEEVALALAALAQQNGAPCVDQSGRVCTPPLPRGSLNPPP